MPKRRGSTKRRMRAVVEGEGEVLVRAAGLAVEHQPAGHAQMQQQDRAVVEEALDVLGPPGEAQHGPALEARAQAVGQGEADVGAALDETGHAPAGQACRQGAHGGLDLGQLRHACRPRRTARLPGFARQPRRRDPQPRMSAAICMSEDRPASPRPRRPRRPGARRPIGWPARSASTRSTPDDEGRPGPRRVPAGGLALRPDERPDERRRPPAVEGGAARLAGAAPRHAPARRRRRHRRRRHALPAAASTARAGSPWPTSTTPCSASAATGRWTPAGSARSTGSPADAMALPFADRSFDAVTIAFGIRNVTRIDQALARGAARAAAGRPLPVPGVLQGRPAGAGPALRRLLLQRGAAARALRRPRRGQLPLPGREHPQASPTSRPSPP